MIKNRLLFGLVVLLSICGVARADITVLGDSAPVGTTPGAIDVNQSGAATFNIPIVIPPGIAGMQPELSLVYSSQNAGKHQVGKGWSLSGVSSITRCPATLEPDRRVGAVNFDQNDRFCLDGQKLAAVNGNYGSPGTQYRSESDNFSRVTSSVNSMPGGGPVGFIVETKSGLKMHYGCIPRPGVDCVLNSKAGIFYHVPTQTALTWPVTYIEDTVGNYIEFNHHYDVVDKYFILENIKYTGNGGHSPQRAIVFDYDLFYGSSAYIKGQHYRRDARLSNITTYLNNDSGSYSNPVRQYILNYENLSADPQPYEYRLQNIQECGFKNGNLADPTCFKPTYFTYFDDTPGFDTANNSPHTSLLFNVNSIHAHMGDDDLSQALINFSTPDINGDSLVDFCYRSPKWVVEGDFFNMPQPSEGIICHLTTEEGFAKGPAIKTNICYDGNTGYSCNNDNNFMSIQYVDVNADGKTDLTYRGDDGVQVWLSDGTGFPLSGRQSSNICSHEECNNDPQFGSLKFLELNGDGLPDMCYRLPETGLNCYLNTGSDATTLNARWGKKLVFDICGSNTEDCTGSSSVNSIQYVDLNRDGLSDLLYRGSNGIVSYLFDGDTETFTHRQ